MATIIGISGKIGVGKDYIANAIATRIKIMRPDQPVLLIAFADMLKMVCLLNDPSIEYEHVFGEKTEASRRALQETGVSYRERFGPNVWVRLLQYTIRMHAERNKIGYFIVTDVRYPSEARALKEMGAMTVRIDAPDRNWTRLLANAGGDEEKAREFGKHSSEVDLDTYEEFDFVIDNRIGASAIGVLLVLAHITK